MIGITKDAIKVGDWITCEDWENYNKIHHKENCGVGYKVTKLEGKNIFVLSTGGNEYWYNQPDGWLLVKRDKAPRRPKSKKQSNYRRIIL